MFFFIFFFFKCNTVNIKIFFFLLAHFNSFLIIVCFSSSSVNAKNKFWGVPHLLHICVIFFKIYFWVSWWTKIALRTSVQFQTKWFIHKSTTVYCSWLIYSFQCWSYSWSSRCFSRYVKSFWQSMGWEINL